MSSDFTKVFTSPKVAGGLKFFKKALIPDIPEVPKAEEPPKIDDPAVQAAAAKERKLLRLRRGRQSTILSRPKLQQSSDTLG